MNSTTLPWMAEIGIITYRTMTGVRDSVVSAGNLSLKNTTGTGPKRPPLPSELLSTFIIFGTYSVIGNGGGYRPRIAALLGWGTVLATFMILVTSIAENPANNPSNAAGQKLQGPPNPTVPGGSFPGAVTGG